MPKIASTSTAKARACVAEFPKEFQLTPGNDLFCVICTVSVNHEKRSSFRKHRETAKHQMGLKKSETLVQSFIPQSSSQAEFADKIVGAFLSADIPLYKVHNQEMKSLFAYLGRPLPSESSLRSRVTALSEHEDLRVKQLLVGKKVFLLTDESEINGKKYFNTLVGAIDDPENTYLVDCRVCEVSADSQYVVRLIDDILKSLAVAREDFALLLSDAARYMTAAGKLLKALYPLLFHVTCVAHMFHNCAEKVRACYPKVDNLIARVKAATVKNKPRKEAFREIGQPPQPVVTRWTTWLRAAIYYADHLPAVKRIVNGFSGDGILVSRAKEAVGDPDLAASLVRIKSDYECLIELVKKSEATSYSVATAHEDLKSIDFGRDPCNLKAYVEKRLAQNGDLTAIATLGREDVSPTNYLLLQRCQATSVCVERSFSMLGKLLAKDRHFKDDNVQKYLMLHYNTVVKK